MLASWKTGICAIFVIILHLTVTFAKNLETAAVVTAEADAEADAEAVDTADVGVDAAGASCYAETKDMYFPIETRHCCKDLNVKCQATTEQDHFCLIVTEEEFKAFGECCKKRGAGRGIEVDPDPPGGASDCRD